MLALALLAFLAMDDSHASSAESRLRSAQDATRVVEAKASAPSSLERATRRALDDGLAYLAARQGTTANGSFPTTDGHEQATLGVTALATLALMASGNSPERGPYGAQVTRAIDYLLDHVDLAPESPEYGYISTGADPPKTRAHAHGYATLALAQAHGMTPRRGNRAARIERALEASVRLIERSQGTEGGWEYEPRAIAAHEGSVTICHVQAMRAARNTGLAVDNDVIRRAEEYVLRLQKADGTFRYKLDMESSTIGLTAAAIATLNMAGRYDTSVIQSGIDAIWSGLELQSEQRERVRWPYYQRFYIAQALWQLADRSQFDRWFDDERQALLRSQADDGSWNDDAHGRVYATAMNCLVLAIPEGLLPIFQR